MGPGATASDGHGARGPDTGWTEVCVRKVRGRRPEAPQGGPQEEQRCGPQLPRPLPSAKAINP